MWIARNSYGTIKLFSIRPKYNEALDEWQGRPFEEIELSNSSFPEVIYENSPVEVELKIK